MFSKKKENKPTEVIVLKLPSDTKWRRFVDWCQIVAAFFVVIAFLVSIKAFGTASQPEPLLLPNDPAGIQIRNVGQGTLSASKAAVGVYYESGGFKTLASKILDLPEMKSGSGAVLSADTSIPEKGFLFIVVVLRSKSLHEDYVQVFYKNLSEKSPWYVADRNLSALNSEPGNHRDKILESIESLKSQLNH